MSRRHAAENDGAAAAWGKVQLELGAGGDLLLGDAVGGGVAAVVGIGAARPRGCSRYLVASDL